MRLTYGNKLGGIPRTNIPVPDDEKRYNTKLNDDGTRTELKDWRLYFKNSSDGGVLPEYNDLFSEKGEFKDGDILYAFRDIRLVPVYDETNERLSTIITGNNIPGRWDLVADLYLYIRREVVIESQGSSPITETMSGILQSDILLANGELEYKIEDCDNNKNKISWYYKFSVDSVESIAGLDFSQTSSTTGELVELRTRLTQDVVIPQLNKNTDILSPDLSKPPQSDIPVMRKIVPLAKRGTTPKGRGVLPESGEYVESSSRKILKWDGFTIDSNETRKTGNNGTERNTYPITQNIIWQTIWKTWMGYQFDNVSVDPTNPRLDDGSDYYDGVMLALEVDGTPLKSDFADGYYMSRSSKWLRVSTRLDDAGYTNIARGSTKCVRKLPNDDCSKVPFTIKDINKRNELDDYKFISKDTSKYYPIPGRPCYQGLPATYDVTSYYEHTSSKECFDGRIDDNGNVYGSRTIQYKYDLVKTENRVVEWENIIRNTIDKTCECIEVLIQNPPCIDPNDPNGCNIIHTDTVYTICPDDGLYYYNNKVVPPNAFPTRLELRQIDKHNCHGVDTPMVLHPINFETDILNGLNVTKTISTFENNFMLSSIFTSSIQQKESKIYYTDIMDTDNNVHMSFIYGHISGSGSVAVGNRVKDSASRTNYLSYKRMIGDDDSNKFSFYTNGVLGNSLDDIYVIKFTSKYMKDRLDAGNFQTTLSDINDETNVITLIDNSNDLTNSKYYQDSPYYSFDLVSGSLLQGFHSSGMGNSTTNNSYTTYGKIYPNIGVLIFDSSKLNSELNFNTVLTSNFDSKNELNLFTSISGAMDNEYPMISRSSRTDTYSHYFIRVPANAVNYSNNPTYFNKNNGKLKYSKFAINPITYITTVGLYDKNNELVAVGKLSKPIKKTMENEVLIDVRLSI